MTDVVEIRAHDACFMKIVADPGVKHELREYFTFQPPGYQFTPAYKNRIWDGKIRLFNPMQPLLLAGLYEYVRKFCDDRGYELFVDPEFNTKEANVPDSYVSELVAETGSTFEPRDYQVEYVLNAIRNNRSLSLSPTSSGKSFIIWLLQQHYHRAYGHRTLIIVPTISLVHQMEGDFVDYGADPSHIHKIQGGMSKTSNCPVVVSTWQSIYKQPKEWFDQFQVVIGDEVHLFVAKSLQTIMSKLDNAYFRHGFTGTLSSDSKVHRLVLEGAFGPVKRFVTTKNLIDDGTVADFNIKALVLSYPQDVRKGFAAAIRKTDKTKRYAAERAFIFANERRNTFIRNLVWSLDSTNNLILFDQIENQGDILAKLLVKEGRQLHYIHGGTPGIERERIRHLVENDPIKQHNILASTGTFSTGVNLKRLDTAIFASAGKSEIRVLQSIGRTLRKGNGADKATLYDIADDLSTGSGENYTLQHFKARIGLYAKEQFPFKILNIEL